MGIDASLINAAGETVFELDLARGDTPLLLRMKEVSCLVDSQRRFDSHAAQTSLDVRPGHPWGSEEKQNRKVFTGPRLDTTLMQVELSDL